MFDLIISQPNIDLSITTPQSLGTITEDCIVPFIFLLATAKENVPMYSGVTISIGTNAPNYNNWLPPTDISELPLNKFQDFAFNNAKIKFSANDELYLKVNNPTQGTFTLKAFGFSTNPNL